MFVVSKRDLVFVWIGVYIAEFAFLAYLFIFFIFFSSVSLALFMRHEQFK